jgi:hypothetical protein
MQSIYAVGTWVGTCWVEDVRYKFSNHVTMETCIPLLAIDDDAELVDYLSAFVGNGRGAEDFALDLCQRRRSVC